MWRRTSKGWSLPPLDERRERFLASGEWSARLVADAAADLIAADPDRPIIGDDTGVLSRTQLFERAIRLGSALSRHGLREGSVVGFQLPNWHEASVISTACALYGFVLCPMLLMYRARELGLILSETGCEALFRPRVFRDFDYARLLDGVLPDLAHKVQVFSVRDDQGQGRSFEDLIGEDRPAVPLPRVDPASIKTITFTSGTTGRPKGVLHSHFTAHATVRRCVSFWGISEDDSLFVPSPIGHIGGSLYAFELPWFTGAPAYLMDVWDAQKAVDLLDAGGFTFAAGATPFLQGLVQFAREKNTHLPRLRRFVCGGASVPPSLVEAGTKQFTNAVVSRAYGSSEVPLVCPGIRDRSDAGHGQNTDGLIDVELRVETLDGEPVPNGVEGDIVVRSPSSFVGYLQSDDEAGQFTEDGFFRTGDLGRRVDGSYLGITGRRKEIIIRMGENISAAEVENALSTCDAIKRVAVVGIAHKRTGERAVAFVELQGGATLTLDDMRRFLETYGLARQKCPEELHVLEALPTNAIGKVMKMDLKAMAQAMTST